jgi:hypothetical protein
VQNPRQEIKTILRGCTKENGTFFKASRHKEREEHFFKGGAYFKRKCIAKIERS